MSDEGGGAYLVIVLFALILGICLGVSFSDKVVVEVNYPTPTQQASE